MQKNSNTNLNAAIHLALKPTKALHPKVTPKKDPLPWKNSLRYSPNKTQHLRYDTGSPRNDPKTPSNITPRLPEKLQFCQTSVISATLLTACRKVIEEKSKAKKEFNTLRTSLGSVQKRTQNRNTKDVTTVAYEQRSTVSMQKKNSGNFIALSSIPPENLRSLNSDGTSFRTHSRASQTAEMHISQKASCRQNINSATKQKQTSPSKDQHPVSTIKQPSKKPIVSSGKSYSQKCLSAFSKSESSNKNCIIRLPKTACHKVLTLESFIIKIAEYSGYQAFYALMISSRKVYNPKLIRKYQLDMCLNGLTKIQRKRLWNQKCQIPLIKELDPKGGKYEEYCKLRTSCDHDIDKDITRTFTYTHQFCKDSENYKKLRRLLHAFAAKHPEIGYIQGLNFVAGNLILLFPEEVFF